MVEHAVAERQKWAKFGAEKGNKPGPDRATTTVGETVSLKFSAGNKVCLPFMISWFVDTIVCFFFQHSEAEQAPEDNVKARLVKAPGAGKVSCRLCKGDHFTAKCPYKDTLGGLESSGEFFYPALIRYYVYPISALP